MFRFLYCWVYTLFLVFAVACKSEPNSTAKELTSPFPAGETVDFKFFASENILSGMFDSPADPANGLILFIHGYGPSDVRGWNMYGDLRPRFNALGFATATWDKPGQGQSSGTFDINQSVYDSAEEVIAAEDYLRQTGAPGSDNIGLWGVSRAGWIAPIALLQDDELNFWISVSGTTAEDNFAHLLLSNLPYEDGTPELAQQLRAEWQAGCKAFRTQEPYESYLQATSTLRANEYTLNMRGDWPNQAQYESQQASCRDGQCPRVDEDLCDYIFIEDFDTMLSQLDVDVLALFGERDLNINWRKVRALYSETIGNNPNATLAIEEFANADHNLNQSETGSLKEMTNQTPKTKVEGYYATQTDWLKTRGLGK
ncbi:MAG: alpha/beta hydrolase [Pseudomonadota bacterium]